MLSAFRRVFLICKVVGEYVFSYPPGDQSWCGYAHHIPGDNADLPYRGRVTTIEPISACIAQRKLPRHASLATISAPQDVRADYIASFSIFLCVLRGATMRSGRSSFLLMWRCVGITLPILSSNGLLHRVSLAALYWKPGWVWMWLSLNAERKAYRLIDQCRPNNRCGLSSLTSPPL
jgi:hypothetical protein